MKELEITVNKILKDWLQPKGEGNIVFTDDIAINEVTDEIVAECQGKYSELLQQRDELKADVEFLAKRQQKAGSITFGAEVKRDTGVSSNSIVSISYGIVKLGNQSFPSDLSDMNACENAWRKLPKHRKTGDALIAMQRARACDYYGKKKAAIKNIER